MKKSLIVALLSTCLYSQLSQANTAIVVTKDASTTGTSYLSYSQDNAVSPNLEYIEAKDFDEGVLKKLHLDGNEANSVIGAILQVPHTYAYLKGHGQNAVVNEKGLMAGICTDYSKLKYQSSFDKDNRIICPNDLITIALERCDNATDAVLLIGNLIDTYGLYGEPSTICLSTKDSAYVVEVMPSVDGIGGYWLAKRIPNGDIFVAADQFRIPTINVDDDSLLFNKGLISKLKSQNLAVFNKDGSLDWIKTTKAVEKRPYYSKRRVWRAFDIVAPKYDLSPYVKNYYSQEYPFSVVPENKLSIVDIMAIHRDTYQGTAFDNSTKNTGGLFASPYTYEDFGERCINSTTTTYTFISEVNNELKTPISWISLGSPGEGVFVPLSVAPIDKAYTNVSTDKYDENKMWWLTSDINALTKGYYSAISESVKTALRESEQREITLLNHSKALSIDGFKRVLKNNVQVALNRSTKLYAKLLENHDGGYKLRYAEGHSPRFIAVDHYHKAKNKVTAVKVLKKSVKKQKKKVENKNLVTKGIPFNNAITKVAPKKAPIIFSNLSINKHLDNTKNNTTNLYGLKKSKVHKD